MEDKMKLFRVYESNDYGKPIKYLGVFKADNIKHSLEIASKYHENEEIVTTGFYDSIEIDDEELRIGRSDAIVDLINKFNIFN
jgi:hypothetical protein